MLHKSIWGLGNLFGWLSLRKPLVVAGLDRGNCLFAFLPTTVYYLET